MSTSYLVVLGRQPELGLVELESLVGADHLSPFGRHAIIDQPLGIDTLGGAVKLGEVVYDGPTADLLSLPIDFEGLLGSGGKRLVALSFIGVRSTPRFALAIGLELKKRLRQAGTAVRLISPTSGLEVSVAQLRHNQVLEHGFELVSVVVGQRMVVARTLAVQNIDWYSRRDYGRPARSAKVGMLPPKLAQILLNTTHGSVIDPFCGTGVVLQEALLVNRTVVGSDLAEDMVAATQQNLTWLEAEAGHPLPAWHVEIADARQVQLPAGTAVVSECYLGPNISAVPAPAKLAKIKAELQELYRVCLGHWAAQLDSGAELALCVPSWRTTSGWQELGLVDELGSLGYTVKVFKHVTTPLRYARDDQIVGRQLLLLRKN